MELVITAVISFLFGWYTIFSIWGKAPLLMILVILTLIYTLTYITSLLVCAMFPPHLYKKVEENKMDINTFGWMHLITNIVFFFAMPVYYFLS